MRSATHTTFFRSFQCLLVAGALLLAAGTSAALAAPDYVPGSASPAEFEPSPGASRSGWTWTSTAQNWVRNNNIIPSTVIARGTTAKLTRAQFVRSLYALESLRARRYGTARILHNSTAGATLSDMPPTSIYARAVKLGWIAPIGTKFAPTSAISANDAALGMAGVLGLRGSVNSLAVRLRTEVPGVSTSFAYAAAHAISRTLGLRYNVLDPNDELELGPTQAVNNGHGSYMLYVAGTQLDGWELDEARRLATTFDLPALTTNQRRVLGAGVKLIGQPYVWGGETEGSQAEGHGGFDCSGFAIRVINGSGLPSTSYVRILERTTYDMSDIPRTSRITRANLRPADVMFFGDNGPSSTNEQNYHAGIYMGNGWFIHSSGGNAGVAIDRLDGYWLEHFSWGRRALRAG